MQEIVERVGLLLRSSSDLAPLDSVRVVRTIDTVSNQVLEVKAVTGSRETSLFVKCEKDASASENLAKEHENLKRCEKIFSASAPEFMCVSAIAFEEGSPSILVLEKCEGVCLEALISESGTNRPSDKGRASLSAALVRVGRWLQVYESGGRGSADVPSFIEQIKEAATWRFDRINSWGSLKRSRRFAEQCLKTIEDVREPDLRESDICFSHGDFHPGNVFVSQDSVSVIDFQLAEPNLIGYDYLFFGQVMALRSGMFSLGKKRTRMIWNSLAESYREKNDLSAMTIKVNKALISLKTLNYLAKVARHGGAARKALTMFDARRLKQWHF